MMARMTISPAEETVNEIFEMRFRERESKVEWDSSLMDDVSEVEVGMINDGELPCLAGKELAF